MNAEQIVRFFTVVGDILEEAGAQEPYKILLIGGGYMITQVGNRDATKDIDASLPRPPLPRQDTTCSRRQW